MFDHKRGFDPQYPPSVGSKNAALKRLNKRLAGVSQHHAAEQAAIRAMAKRLTEEARQRAIDEGVPFDLKEDYVAEQLSLGCPVFGVEFDFTEEPKLLDIPTAPHAPTPDGQP